VAARNAKIRGKSKQAPRLSYMPCRVEPGMFRGEYLVSFDAIDSQNPREEMVVRLLADEQEVVIRSGVPQRGNPAEGLLRVEVLERAKGLALLVLPQPAQPVGERTYVLENLVQEEAAV
jgi:hypothetical protein